ncbi:hypothetical protein B0J13DRAFT_557295 [Dactylonectria estremocensis]|uniref:Uncharacterized protein n=1 Tax=Dactylonectria estremocensis TaxID=1079267 RepID=A0A9P9EL34_9HYPO|nr:hypothetical protein B0J13DRAFT_557295 [Dactylonectria estremocensis]
MTDDLESNTMEVPMSMKDMSSWLVAHVVLIFAHFGLMLAGAVGFVTASLGDDDAPSFWIASALGCITMTFNIFYTSACANLEQRNAGATHESRRFVKQIVLAIGTSFNLVFVVVADFAFMAGVGRETQETATLIFVRMFAFMAG